MPEAIPLDQPARERGSKDVRSPPAARRARLICDDKQLKGNE
jgi:hypothetical protein